MIQHHRTMTRRSFEVKQVGPVTLIKPTASDIVERELIDVLSEELLEYVGQEQPKNIVFTLKHVTRYSSAAIGGLIEMERRVRRYGGEVKLCMDSNVRHVFKVTGLDGNVFAIYETESDAIAAFFQHGGDIF
jgi:anti-sigma B factor antagonist